MRGIVLLLMAALPAVALATSDPEFDREAQIVDWLRAMRAVAPDADVRARVEALTHYESKATRPSPEPRSGDETVAAFNVASEARGTLRAWERNAGLPPASIARAPASKAATPGSIIHYVESASSGDCTPDEICTEIGLPVPMPVDSQLPVAGFRTYDSLIAGLKALVAQNTDIASTTNVGTTAANRDIVAFEIGASGSPAFLQSGGIHAREWIAPEVVARYIERVLANRHDGALHQYLIENVKSVLIPVLNVDGFLQTQRFPDRAVASTCSEDAANEPRDGRMRRKNMSADGTPVDELLTTIADDMLGVDENRNNLPWWGGTPGSSGNPCSLIYRGASAESTRELQALNAAAALAPSSRLRLYIDTHSYTRAYLAADTDNARRNAIQRQLAQRMSAVAGGRYLYSSSSAGHGIGSTDEHFANTYQIPAYTLEVEPTLGNGIADYGGIDVPDSGFILPSAEVPRVRDQMVSATVLGVYRQAGPPSVSAVSLLAGGDAVVFQGHWTSGNARSFAVDQRQPLQAGGSYTVQIGFDKPMRVRDGSGNVAQYGGQNVALNPTLALVGIDSQAQPFTVPIDTSGQWTMTHYADDTYSVQFQIPAGTPVANAKRLSLAVTAADLSGNALDANPATPVAWNSGAWSGYEDAACTSGDTGGTDSSVRIVDDGTPLCAAASGGGGGGALDVCSLVGLLLIRLRRSRK